MLLRIIKALSLSLLLTVQPLWAAPVVCGVIQTYSALESIKDSSKVKFETFYGTQLELRDRILLSGDRCDVLVTDEEKLPKILIDADRALYENVSKLVRAPLILWSGNRFLFQKDISAITKKKLRSLIVPKAHLTSVGYAANQVLNHKDFPIDYLEKKGKIFKADHEYQAYSLLEPGNVQVGFLTKPLIMKDAKTTGSYWYIPNEYYDPIYYYLVMLSEDPATRAVCDLLSDPAFALRHFKQAGFESVD